MKNASRKNIYHFTPPPLETGDTLTRDEFERRYDAMPHLKKAELIEGKVYMSSPVRHRYHGKPHSRMVTFLTIYSESTLGTDYSDNATIRMDEENMPQPDVSLFIEESAGGSTQISNDDYIEGAPEVIVEISGSTASYDMNEKLEVYRRNGVREYIVWRVYDNEIDWFILENEKYVELKQDDDGILRSRVFPGLWLDRNAMLNEELNKVMETLQNGLASAEHKEFIEKLSNRK